MIDTTVAHPSRMYDYLLGGVDHFAVDRAAVDAAADTVGGIDNAKATIRANRDFLIRAVRYLASEAGIRQFLDIGTGIPNADNVHGIAQQVAPASRIVYVDNDPIVLAHAHTLLRSSPEGATSYVFGDLRNPDDIVREATATLDFAQPVAVVLVAILHFFPDTDDPYSIVDRLLDAVPSGSYLALSHLASDIQPDEMAALAKRYADDETIQEAFVMRSHAEVCRFFAGLDVIEPGVAPLDVWCPPQDPRTDGWQNPIWGGIGRKP
ncbi:MAG: SAM-dependent methyltransferase [Acidimicrobiales bacterium]